MDHGPSLCSTMDRLRNPRLQVFLLLGSLAARENAPREERWQALGSPMLVLDADIAKRFALFGGAVVIATTALVGWMSTTLITRNVLGTAASSTALFVDSIVTPHVQDLTVAAALQDTAIEALDRTFLDPVLRDRFPFIEIWKADGTIVYSNHREMIGRSYPPPPSLAVAFEGEIASDFTDLRAQEHTVRQLDEEYLEIYTPIRDLGGGTIIAVAEIHESAEAVRQELDFATRRNWALVVTLALLVMAGLLTVVMRGNAIIRAQQRGLVERIEETERALEEVRRLKDAVQSATARLVEREEKAYRRIGADLHDGPAQLISYSTLKLEQIRRARSIAERSAMIEDVERALVEAVGEIRNMSQGLVLPDLDRMPVPKLIDAAIGAHEERTGNKVDRFITIDDPVLSRSFKICVYRFLQEALWNVHRHAPGTATTACCDIDAETVRVSVSNLPNENSASWDGRPGLGISGLKERVESLGGTFTIAHDGHMPTRLEMTLLKETA